MVKPRIYLRRNFEQDHLDSNVYEDIFYTFLSFIIQSSTYAVFPLVSVRDKIFILFLLMTWPEYLFLK